MSMAKQGPKTVVPRLRFPEFLQDYPWAVRLLGNDATFEKGRGVSKAEVDPNGQHQCIRYGELYTRYSEVIREVVSRTSAADSTLFFSQTNDVIVPASGETKEDIATASCVLLDGVALGGDLNVIRSPHNGVFLSYLLNGSQRRELAKVAQGDTVVHLYPRQLAALSIAFPDAAEQQKIADCLTSLDEVIAAQGRKVEALKAHKRGLMQQLFPREGETRPRLRFPEFRDAPEWEKKQLAELGEIITGKTPSTSNAGLWGGGILFITPTDIDDSGKYQDTSQRTVVATSALKVLPVGSIAYTCIASIGKLAITVRPSVTNQQINSVITRPSIDNEFVYYALVHLTPWIKSIPATSTLPIINKTEFSAIEIGIPSDSLEQKAVADCLSSLDTRITAETARLAALKTHKQGLMQQLFPAPEAATA